MTDLADAHIKAYEYLRSNGRSDSFNLGNGHGYSVRDVVDVARKISGREIKITEADRRIGDPPKLISDCRKAKRNIGWNPQYPDLETIIETAWKWHSSSI